ncbi:MAG: lactonase family protein [Bacteroidales bacterium]|nr:lactonase family protein [Bacteroidales bacterium]
MNKSIAITVMAVLLAACCRTSEAPEGQAFLVGTYTDGNSSAGVYCYSYFEESNGYNSLDTASFGNPSFVIERAAECGRAYSVSEYDDGRQAVVSYKFPSCNQIDVLNSQPTDGEASGAAPCNIIIAGGSVITSNYTGGTLTAFPILEDGSLGPMSQQFAPGMEDGLVHHMHCCVLSPDGRYLFACDLGADRVYRFTVGDATCPLKDATIAYQFDTEEHPGPRHMVFSPDGRFAYLIHELGDCLTVFSYADGALGHVSTELAYDGEGHGSADIHLTPDGRFLYTSHRLKKDGISIFKVDEDGSVQKVGYQQTGIHPRNFAITPSGRHLLCACRDSDRIEIYEIDPETGALTDTGARIEVPAPVCVQFLK